jgi:hypothetical protein
MTKYEGKRYREAVANRICVECGITSTADTVQCRPCAHKLAARRRERLASKRPDECVDLRCAEPRIPGNTMCKIHVMIGMAKRHFGKESDWPNLVMMMEEQRGRCYFTGDSIEFGVNASLEHILPKARFPERRRDPTNFALADLRVNKSKGDMTEWEFVSMCMRVVDRYYERMEEKWERLRRMQQTGGEGHAKK